MTASENVDGANTGIRHLEGGDKFIKETGNITAGEHLTNGSTGIYMKGTATGTARLETTGMVHAKNALNTNTGIIDG